MTRKQALQAIKALGMTAKVTDGEFRVNFKGGTEATAYYTDDAEDAVATARAMAEGGKVKRNPAPQENIGIMIAQQLTSALTGNGIPYSKLEKIVYGELESIAESQTKGDWLEFPRGDTYTKTFDVKTRKNPKARKTNPAPREDRAHYLLGAAEGIIQLVHDQIESVERTPSITNAQKALGKIRDAVTRYYAIKREYDVKS